MGLWVVLLVSIASFLIGTGIVFAAKYYFAPRFIIGILPSRSVIESETIPLESIRTENPLYEAVFEASHLAKPVWEDADLETIKDEGHAWKESLEAGKDTLDLALIVQNIGRSVANGYYLAISFAEPEIQLLNVETESLSVEMSYTQVIPNKPSNLKKPAQFIVDTYKVLKLPCSFVSFVGNLESMVFEMVHLTLKVPPHVQSFVTVYRIQCPKAWHRTAFYAQRVELNRK